MNTKWLFLVIVLVFLGFFLTTCSQEPLFYYIHLEYPPIEPIIGGAPTEIVEAGGVVYVANRESLWTYDKTLDQWERISTKPGTIKAIAATSADLYVLDDGGTIYKSSNGGINWESSIHISGAQQIYGARDTLFAGNGSAVYVCNFTSLTATSITGSSVPGGLLRGAAYAGGTYYICTANVRGNENTGIFTVSGTTATKVYPSNGSSSVKGIIAAGSAIVAVTGSAVVYKDSATNFDSPVSPNVSFTGGMALWPNTTSPTKVLLGLQKAESGTFRYGYREFDLDGPGKESVYVPGNTDDGKRTTSIDPGSTQTSSIGKYPVTALYAIPGSNSGDNLGRPIIFASTQQNGVWSYRVRRGAPQWNGEDNNTR
jgi:hypothetical protein